MKRIDREQSYLTDRIDEARVYGRQMSQGERFHHGATATENQLERQINGYRQVQPGNTLQRRLRIGRNYAYYNVEIETPPPGMAYPRI